MWFAIKRVAVTMLVGAILVAASSGCGSTQGRHGQTSARRTQEKRTGTGISLASANAIPPAPAFTSQQLAADPGANWITVHGNLGSDAHSTLNQITPDNAKNLGLAWSATLDGSCAKAEACAGEGNALVYQGVYYIQTGADDVFALDAATGKHLWKYTPKFPKSFGEVGGVSRGMAMGDGNLYIPRIDGKVGAVDMTTGKHVWTTELANWKQGYQITAAPVYYDGKVIVSMSGGDSGNSDFMAAVDAKTGKKLWQWDVVPRPGQPQYKTWGDPNAYKHGGGAIWNSVSVDPKLGLVYFGTGNQVPWNTRPPGKELWADSVVALHADTGKFAWGYQTVHHDVWDDDIPSSLVLYDAPYRPYRIDNPGRWVDDPSNGFMGSHSEGVKVTYTGPPRMQPALAVASKMGFTFVLNRKTGKPLIPAPEMKVDQTNSKGLHLWSTQPIPLGQYFSSQCVLPSQWNKAGPDGKPVQHGCAFTPVNRNHFVAIPHDEGEWMPSSYDPATHQLYVCTIDNRAWAMKGLSPAEQQKQLQPGASYTGIELTQGTRKGYRGGFTAINLLNNSVTWRQDWPDFCYSGATSTAGGVVMTAHNDGRVQVIDAKSGDTLWQSTPPKTSPAANAPVITYEAGGKQYMSVFAAGDAHENTPRGDAIYTFALGAHKKPPKVTRSCTPDSSGSCTTTSGK